MALAPPAPPRQELLRPVRPAFIWLTTLVALLLNLLPWSGLAALFRPDFLALVLLFWMMREPQLVGFAAAFTLGLLMDVAHATLFGQHALAYTLLAYSATLVRRRLRMFSVAKQLWHVLPVLLAVQAVILLVRMAAGADFPGFAYFGASFTAAALWPFVCALLLLPQRPRVDPEHPIRAVD